MEMDYKDFPTKEWYKKLEKFEDGDYMTAGTNFLEILPIYFIKKLSDDQIIKDKNGFNITFYDKASAFKAVSLLTKINSSRQYEIIQENIFI